MLGSTSVCIWAISIPCAIGVTLAIVEMQWLMLQQEQPEDFVIATGRQESVRRFIELTAKRLGWGPMQWDGEGTLRAVAVETPVRWWCASIRVTSDRPRLRHFLATQAKLRTSWGGLPRPPLEELIAEMVDADVEEAKKNTQAEGFVVVGHGNDFDYTQDRFAIFG